MSPRRGPWIAILLLALFVAATIWLPLSAALGICAIFMLSGVVLFRRPAWRTTSLVLASLLAGLAVLELAFGLIVPGPRNFGVVKLSEPEHFVSADPELGYRLTPDTLVRVTARYGDELVFKQTYTIDAWGVRVTPGAGPDAPTWMFIGDSFTFGEGLADSETLPAQFAGLLTPAQRVVNLGVPGYAPNHLVRALESGLFDSHITGKVAAAVFWISPPQMERVTGDGDWLTFSPHYELIPGEPPRHTGSFLAWRLSHPLEGLSYFARSRFAWVMRIVGPGLERRQEILYVALIERLRDLVRQKWNAPLIIVYDWADGTITDQNDERLRPVYQSIAALGMPMVSMRRLSLPHVGWPEFTIPHDGHPSALMDRTVARGLFDKARELGLQ